MVLGLSAAVAATSGTIALPTGDRPVVTPASGTVVAPRDAQSVPDDGRARAEWNVQRAYSIARYLQRAVQDYTATRPDSLGSFPSSLTFVAADTDSERPSTVSVLGADASRLYLAAAGGDGTCAYLRDDRSTDRVETVTTIDGAHCRAGEPPPSGWREILVD